MLFAMLSLVWTVGTGIVMLMPLIKILKYISLPTVIGEVVRIQNFTSSTIEDGVTVHHLYTETYVKVGKITYYIDLKRRIYCRGKYIGKNVPVKIYGNNCVITGGKLMSPEYWAFHSLLRAFLIGASICAISFIFV